MSSRWFPYLFSALCFVLLHGAASAQTVPTGACSTVHAIEVRGNSRMSADAIRFDLKLRRGDAWDDVLIHREFRRFWQRGYFADLRFFKRCDEDGATLIIEVEERPTVLAIEYQKVKPVNQQQIDDYYKEREFVLGVGSPLDRKKLWRAESLVKELLAQKGYLDSRVKAVVREMSPSSRSVYFQISPGGKTRIRKLEFVGNEAFRDRVLLGQLEMTKAWRWWWPFSSKSLYHPLKYQQDINSVLDYYRDRGYLDADVAPPLIDIKAVEDKRGEKRDLRKARKQVKKEARKRAKAARRAAKKGQPLPSGPDGDAAVENLAAAPGPREKKWVYLKVPLSEGPVYRLGEITFEGNTLFDAEVLRHKIPVPEAGVLSDNALEFGLERIRALYATRGYAYSVVTRRFERHESGEPIADVIVTIDEDQAYTVGEIEFRGNTATNDEVLRRELNIGEGEVLNRDALDVSLQKLRMLGFWMPGEEAELTPDVEKAEVDIVIQGEEQSRNEVQVGGGYSELEGGFFLASYQTRNFLGRGETLSLFLSVGGRSNNATLSFMEPWFLGRPYSFGFTISRRELDFGRIPLADGGTQRLTQNSTGGSIIVGKRIGNYSRLQMRYSYESIIADTPDISASFTRTETRLASITPIFNTRHLNNPLRPTRGYELTIMPQITAEFLGSEVNFIRPRIEGSYYRPVYRKFFVALHGEFAWINRFGSKVVRKSGFVDGVPRFQRFFMGGDTIGPRVFETRSLSPLRWFVPVDVNGDTVPDPITGIVTPRPALVGGSKFGLVQAELGLPIGKTATIAAFVDAGGVYDNGVDFGTEDLRVSAGLEFRVFLPVFQAPIRLIYGWPLREVEGDRTNRFQFSIGLPF